MKTHKYVISLIFLLGMSCSQMEFVSVNQAEKFQSAEDIPAFEKKGLQDQWFTVLHNVVINKSDPIVFLKDTAKYLGLNIIIETKDISIPQEFYYQACEKKFIDIVLDIAESLNLKVLIKGLNAIISEDSIYLHTYLLKDLPGEYNVKTQTSLQNNFEKNTESKANTNNEYSSTINYYSEIEKNLNDLFKDIQDAKYTINKQGGVLIVIAKQKMHKQISSYLASLYTNASDQILVEANIVEVALNKGYEMGIDWVNIFSLANMPNMIVKNAFSVDNPMIQLSYNGADILRLLNANYKKVKSISNPRMMLANNHSGVFKAVENYPYFDYKVDTIDVGQQNALRQSKSVELKNVVIGVTLYVHVLKLDESNIKVYFKPSVTEISKEIDHDGYKYLTADFTKTNGSSPKVPVLRTREMDSTITLKNGQSVVIGGLILEKLSKSSSGLSSFLSMITFGLLADSSQTNRSELVILLTVNGSPSNNNFDYYQILELK